MDSNKHLIKEKYYTGLMNGFVLGFFIGGIIGMIILILVQKGIL